MLLIRCIVGFAAERAEKVPTWNRFDQLMQNGGEMLVMAHLVPLFAAPAARTC
jgi:hypothetical protein